MPARQRWHRLLLLLPFVWHLVLAPAVNGVRWNVAGLPFPMVWQMLGILVSSSAIAIVFRIGERQNPGGEAPR